MSQNNLPKEEIVRRAVISQCGKYRYRLYREWAQSNRMPVMWLMLNPSTADGETDDATIRRCMKFSQHWGYGAMWVGNLYAWRATNPKDLPAGSSEAIGEDNEAHLCDMGMQSAKVICAWGANVTTPQSVRVIGCPGGYWHLGLTANGQPKHPLARGKAFIPYGQPLAEYRS